MIHTPTVGTTAACPHDLIVDEIIIGEILSDLLLDFNFFRFSVGIEAPLIIGEQVHETTGAKIPVLDILSLCIWPFYTANTRVFDLLCLYKNIEFRECFTTARAFHPRFFCHSVNTNPTSHAYSALP